MTTDYPFRNARCWVARGSRPKSIYLDLVMKSRHGQRRLSIPRYTLFQLYYLSSTPNLWLAAACEPWIETALPHGVSATQPGQEPLQTKPIPTMHTCAIPPLIRVPVVWLASNPLSLVRLH